VSGQVSGDPPVPPGRQRVLATTPGSRPEAFGLSEWGLLATVAVIWGSSFFFIAVGLDAFAPPVVTWLRILLGTVTLALFPAARRPVARMDWPRVVALSLLWMAIPLSLFPIAQQWVASAVAGMLNGAVPLFSAFIATLLLRRLPGRVQIVGLLLGFAGVVAITLSTGQELDATTLGLALMVTALILYGLAVNVAVPLQQSYGALPVLFRAQVVALVLVTPFGLAGLPASNFAWPSALAMVPLGVLGTGIAYVAMTTLIGRAGASRGTIPTYFIPVVAIFLGVAFRGEDVATLAFVGTALVLAGAWLTSRREEPVGRPPPAPA
jgi:drug/metabolite transporter (DMT)-like permease